MGGWAPVCPQSGAGAVVTILSIIIHYFDVSELLPQLQLIVLLLLKLPAALALAYCACSTLSRHLARSQRDALIDEEGAPQPWTIRR